MPFFVEYVFNGLKKSGHVQNVPHEKRSTEVNSERGTRTLDPRLMKPVL
jgi:hypothetical protein